MDCLETSNEIVSVQDGSDNEVDFVLNGSASKGLDLTKGFRPRVKINLIGGNHKLNEFLSPEQGHKHVNHYNPTPASIKPILEKIKEPSVLLLRGCELLLQQAHFPFENFKTLTSLEISGISFLTSVPDAISEMTQLQSLNLSHLPIQQFPSDDFFSKLTNFRSLVLRGCFNLQSLPTFPPLPALQCLDLSYLPIEAFPFYYYNNELRWLILKGCSRLRSLPDLTLFTTLEEVDLSQCTTLQQMQRSERFCHHNLQKLDLSGTPLLTIVLSDCRELTHLYFRDTKAFIFKFPNPLPKLTMVDLSGVQNLVDLHELRMSCDLVVLDLSRTSIESIGFISDLIHLRHLILRECTRLVNLPEMKRLTNIEVVDISGCEILGDLPEDLNSLRKLKELNLSGCCCLKELREGLFDDLSCLEKLDLSKTNANHLPSFANLTNLQTLNLSHTPVEKLPDLSNLINLKDLLLENCHKLEVKSGLLQNVRIDFTRVHSSGLGNVQERILGGDGNIPSTHILERISSSDEFHLVSTFIGKSGFDRFKYEFEKLNLLISNVEENIKLTSLGTITTTTDEVSENLIIKKFGSIHRDLRYLLKNIYLLESSSKYNRCEELLHELMDAAIDISEGDFSLDSIDSSELIRVVAMLKLLVPPPKQVGGEEDEEKKKKKKKKILLTGNKEMREVDDSIRGNTQDLISSYESLTDIQRNCLLYFGAFPSSEYGILVKERKLIHLWYGEGFIDPILYEPTSNQSLNNRDPDPILELSTSTSNVLAGNDASRKVSTRKGMENPNTIREIGQHILKALEEKEFISPQSERQCFMDKSVHYFVKEQAKASFFFDFNEKNGMLTHTPYFTGSQRACLLKSQDHCPSSCQLWSSYTHSSRKLDCFKDMHTLLHVSESILDLNVKWFSKMRNLIVLHLGDSFCENEEHINIMDLKFLEELQNMKQLRHLCLDSFSAIVKLPNSMCKLTNLRMLNLRYCCNLEELPAGIGSLENLTHLDLTHCHLLSKLPKGIMLLSKLVSLKGFVITYNFGGQQHTKACTLRELLKLENLRNLHLVVNRDNFPYSNDLEVFQEMEKLSNLQITWRENRYKDQEPKDAIGHEALRHSKWKQLKCWKQQECQSDTKEQLRSNQLHELRKLTLCCFPLETAPNWLHPNELKKLEKLYIIGGNIKTLHGGTDQNAWSVKTLILKYLSNMDMDWHILKGLFLHMTYFAKYDCPHIQNFTGTYDVWRKESDDLE